MYNGNRGWAGRRGSIHAKLNSRDNRDFSSSHNNTAPRKSIASRSRPFRGPYKGHASRDTRQQPQRTRQERPSRQQGPERGKVRVVASLHLTVSRGRYIVTHCRGAKKRRFFRQQQEDEVMVTWGKGLDVPSLDFKQQQQRLRDTLASNSVLQNILRTFSSRKPRSWQAARHAAEQGGGGLWGCFVVGPGGPEFRSVAQPFERDGYSCLWVKRVQNVLMFARYLLQMRAHVAAAQRPLEQVRYLSIREPDQQLVCLYGLDPRRLELPRSAADLYGTPGYAIAASLQTTPAVVVAARACRRRYRTTRYFETYPEYLVKCVRDPAGLLRGGEQKNPTL